MKLKSISAVFADDLQDPEFIAAYLTDAANDHDPRVFLTALRRVMQAHNVSKISGQLTGNSPTYEELATLLHQVGMHIAVQPDTLNAGVPT